VVQIAGICRDLNWPDGLRGEVIQEIEQEQRILDRASKKGRGLTFGYLLAILLLASTTVLILAVPEGVLAWFIVAFVLYSFNFIILFLPTTRKGKRDESCRRTIGRDAWAPVKFLLKKKTKLAIEVGLTMFLGGMVPLALSFFLIFGLGLVLTFYFAFFEGVLDTEVAWLVIVQMVTILVFFVVILLTQPQAQGFTRIARAFKGRYDRARGKGRLSQSAMLLAMGLVAAGLAILFVGAILLTGGVLSRVIEVGGELRLSILLVLVVFVVQIVVMRHFQVVSSQRMARALLEVRLETLRKEVLEPLSAILEQGKYADKETFDKAEFERIKTTFFNVVIYGVFELNFFGFSPVYVVGPNVKFLIDDRVLPYVGGV